LNVLRFHHIPIYERDLSSAVQEFVAGLDSSFKDEEPVRCISATGAHGLVEALKDSSFKIVLTSFFWNLPDGMPLVWWGRLKGYASMDRCYGPDFFAAIMQATSGLEVAHFFCGGKAGVAEELKQSVEVKWDNKNVRGVYSPPFSPMQEDDWGNLVTKINESNAQIIWIGLSTPKQEKFAYELAKRVRVRYIITVGAAFDFHTGRLAQATRWMQRSGLEWFYRLYKEPRRLWKRYMEIVPKFAIPAGVDLIKHYLRKRN
jgi:N-acetylglucosaminyldiphosphoundecaprenol N-acetyl-beta-D-mannosaminyltransferase